MFMKSLALLSLLPAFASAQGYGYGGGSSPAPTTSASAPATVPSAPPGDATHINVDVFAGGKFVFSPNNINATVGTIVTFFFPGGTVPHSVTQSSFANPCTHLEANATSNTPAGFDSDMVTTGSTFSINVTDTQPIWFHCKVPTHCGLGMVGSINAPTNGTNTFEAFQNAAINLGSKAPTDTATGVVTGGVHGVATAAPSSDVGSGGAAGSGGTKPSGATKVVASAAFALLSGAIGIAML